MWSLKNGRRESVEDLQEALDYLAECNGGYHSCLEGVRLKDQTTGTWYLLTVNAGELQLNGVDVVPEPEEP